MPLKVVSSRVFCRQIEKTRLNIKELLEVEHELSTDHSAKTNLLKYLQVEAVQGFQEIADALYFTLRHDEDFDELERIKSANNGATLEQPRLKGTIEDYLRDAGVAKCSLDALVGGIARECAARVYTTNVKSFESTKRKVEVRGSIRKVTDMARVSVVCDTIKSMVNVFELLDTKIQVGTRVLVWPWNRLPSHGSLKHSTLDGTKTSEIKFTLAGEQKTFV